MSFVYHGQRVGFRWSIKKPCCDIIPSQASVVLARAAEKARETVRNFNYKGIVTFDEASVYVAGSQNGRYRNTVATASHSQPEPHEHGPYRVALCAGDIRTSGGRRTGAVSVLTNRSSHSRVRSSKCQDRRPSDKDHARP